MKVRLISLIIVFLLLGVLLNAQSVATKWYSENTTDGITIQNSYPSGGRYTEPTTTGYNQSYLVFHTRMVNETETPLTLELNFLGEAIAIPHSPDTYLNLFLPADTMALAKQILPYYGLTDLSVSNQPTSIKRKLAPGEDCLFYIMTFFYQTEDAPWSQERGGNRAELLVKGQKLFYRMPPQVELLPCGKITFDKWATGNDR